MPDKAIDLIDVGAVLDGYDRWEKIYRDVISERGAGK